MVISGGVNIYPWEIEQRLHEHPAVQEAAVVGIPDPEWGESLAAFIVLRDGEAATGEELGQWVKETLADYKRPRTFVFVDVAAAHADGQGAQARAQAAPDADLGAGERVSAARVCRRVPRSAPSGGAARAATPDGLDRPHRRRRALLPRGAAGGAHRRAAAGRLRSAAGGAEAAAPAGRHRSVQPGDPGRARHRRGGAAGISLLEPAGPDLVHSRVAATLRDPADLRHLHRRDGGERAGQAGARRSRPPPLGKRGRGRDGRSWRPTPR